MTRFISYIAFVGALASNLPYVASINGTPQVENSASVPVSCPDIGSEYVVDFADATVETNTLGNTDNGGGELRFANVGTYREGGDSASLELVIRETPGTSYVASNLANNGKNDYYGMINLESLNGEGTFDFCFENNSTRDKVTMDAFFLSFYDLDGHNGSFETISLQSSNFTEAYLSDNTEIDRTEDDGLISFTASTNGEWKDNPEDPDNLSEQQMNRGVSFLIENTACVQVKLSVSCTSGCDGGRNFLFSGRANQIVPTCAPTTSPTKSPTGPNTASPTKAPTRPDTASPTTSPTKAPTGPNTASPTESPSTYPHFLNGGGAKTQAPTPGPTGGGVKGDPHFKTWNGDRYDFHGVCDLVLVHNLGFETGLGMDIHIRTKKVRQWSSVASAVVRIGEDTFEILAEKNEDKVWLNGIFIDSNNKKPTDMSISGYKINTHSVNKQQNEYEIDLGNGEKIALYTWKSMVRVEVLEPTDKNFETSAGLMGSFKHSQWMARDGKTVFSDANAFGEEWQVLPNELTFFHNAGDGPQAPSKCLIPSKTALRRRLEKSDVTIEEAEKVCAGIVDTVDLDLCVFDVMASGDKEMAGAY